MNTATRTARPLTADQTEYLRMVLDLIRANGGTTCLTRAPVSLIKRGLLCVAVKAEGSIKPGRTGWKGSKARYTLTAAGMEIANVAEQARIERANIRRANRGSNAMIG